MATNPETGFIPGTNEYPTIGKMREHKVWIMAKEKVSKPVQRAFLVIDEEDSDTPKLVTLTIPTGSRFSSSGIELTLEPPIHEDWGIYFMNDTLLPVEVWADSTQDIKWDTGNSKVIESDKVVFDFQFDLTPENPCNNGSQEKGIALSFDECFDYTNKTFKEIKVPMKVDIAGLPAGLATYSWAGSVLRNPNSGTLSNENQAEALFSNPQKAGRYLFYCDLNISGQDFRTATQIVCPPGGPDITAYTNSEIVRYDTWAKSVETYVNTGSALTKPLRITKAVNAYIKTGNDMDHGLLKPLSNDCPCRRINFGLTTGTIDDYVFKVDWLGNMLLGYVMEIYDPTGIGVGAVGGITEFITLLDGDFTDDPEDQEAYRVGASKANGSSLKHAIESHDIRLMQKFPANVLWACKEETYTPPSTPEFAFPTHNP